MAQREGAPKAAVGGGGRRPDGGLVALEMGGAGGERAAEREGRAAWAAAAGVGLVLLGTPLVAWLSLFASGAGRWLGGLRAGADRPPVAPTVVPER